MHYELLIIGSGPAGLSAAVCAAHAGLRAAVIERYLYSGGQLLNAAHVDNYLGIPDIGGFDLAARFREHAEKSALEQGGGIPFITAAVTAVTVDESGRKTVVCGDNIYTADALIIAAGASRKRLKVPGEGRLNGRGVSYCAACDGSFFRGKAVAVAGEDDMAAEEALYLS
ncbi:MAG: FAD-dependent oxidoreductase, partial [Oscillospiraceae bacterium]|nr:FAD-dependent oxidoreductase [Oscillospiraceae bacterium]